jgi:hypothetical protein
MNISLDSTTQCGVCNTVDGCVCPVPTKRPRRDRQALAWSARRAAELHRQESIELEREACIMILEDMRPRNDPSDWNEFTVTTDSFDCQPEVSSMTPVYMGALAPCPFCGEAEAIGIHTPRKSAVRCGVCLTDGPQADSPAYAREGWNTRADPAAVVDSGFLRALLIAAPSHQGGHSYSGAAIAKALRVPFPLTMPSLRAAAIDSGFSPVELWPWMAKAEANISAA